MVSPEPVSPEDLRGPSLIHLYLHVAFRQVTKLKQNTLTTENLEKKLKKIKNKKNIKNCIDNSRHPE